MRTDIVSGREQQLGYEEHGVSLGGKQIVYGSSIYQSSSGKQQSSIYTTQIEAELRSELAAATKGFII